MWYSRKNSWLNDDSLVLFQHIRWFKNIRLLLFSIQIHFTERGTIYYQYQSFLKDNTIPPLCRVQCASLLSLFLVFFVLRISELAATFHFPSIQTSKTLSHFYTSSFISTSVPSYFHTSTSRGPSWISDATRMSKQVTIMTRDLHRLTQYSSSLVTCSSASKYSCDSRSKSRSTSTVWGTISHYLLLRGKLTMTWLRCNT